MKSDFKFSNLLGTVYRNGNLTYTKDGKTLLSPVGNRISVFDLINNTSFTFDYQHRKNIKRIAINDQNTLLISVDVDGRAILVNFRTKQVLHHFNFKSNSVNDIKFSPDGKFFAIATGRFVQIWQISSSISEDSNKNNDDNSDVNYNDRQFAPFVKYRKHSGHFNDIISLSWSKDSRFILSTSKDMTTRIWSLHNSEASAKMSLAGHRDYVVNAFFSERQDIIYTLSKDGALLQWEYTRKPKNESDTESEDEEDEEEETNLELNKLSWRITKKNYFFAGDHVTVKSSTFHPNSNLLIVGFSNGEFRLYELPSFVLIQQLSMGQNAINTIEVNNTGEWIAFGSAKLGQLLVYEWQSESYILKQQGHFDSMNALCYSPDGSRVVTASDDGKIKIWDINSGFCLATFDEHTSAVTGVQFAKKGQVLFSCSLDGTVRAWDLIRYRNFRTFTSTTERIQFNSLAVDPSGEVVVASSLNSFDIFVWSVQTGQLLDNLSGHEGPVSFLSFGVESSVLASASWDKTIRIWDIFGRSQQVEPIQLYSDVLAIAMRPDSKQLAVSTLDGQVSFWDIENAKQIGNVDAKKDIISGRYLNDAFTSKNSKRSKFFSTIAYSFDGSALICGGKNNSICIYDIANEVLLKRFKVSENMALDGTLTKLNSARLTEDGVNLDLIDNDGENSDLEDRVDSSLPGSQRGDPSLRKVRPEIRITSINFSPTANAFAAASTEGLLIYSVDSRVIFDPFDLDIDVTPENILHELELKNYLVALVMSFRLNERYLILKVFESIPVRDIKLILADFPEIYLQQLLNFLSEFMAESQHFEFNMIWLKEILNFYGKQINQNKAKLANSLKLVQRFINRVAKDIISASKNTQYLYTFLETTSANNAGAEEDGEFDADDVLIEVGNDGLDDDDDDEELGGGDGNDDDDDDDDEWLDANNIDGKKIEFNGFDQENDDDEDSD